MENQKKQKELEKKSDVSKHHSRENTTEPNMKKIIILIVIVVGIWWGWTHLFQGSGTDLAIERIGKNGATAKISSGEPIDLKQHLIPGKYTVFIFYADW